MSATTVTQRITTSVSAASGVSSVRRLPRAAAARARERCGTAWDNRYRNWRDVQLETELLELFSVPLLKCRWPDNAELNSALVDAILARSGEEGVTISNVGGWHSSKDLQDWSEDCVHTLVGHMKAIGRLACEKVYPAVAGQLSEGWEVEAWANVNHRGAFNQPHDHSGQGSIWSGIYYVRTDPETHDGAGAGGLTKFENRSLVPLPRLTGYGLAESGVYGQARTRADGAFSCNSPPLRRAVSGGAPSHHRRLQLAPHSVHCPPLQRYGRAYVALAKLPGSDDRLRPTSPANQPRSATSTVVALRYPA